MEALIERLQFQHYLLEKINLKYDLMDLREEAERGTNWYNSIQALIVRIEKDLYEHRNKNKKLYDYTIDEDQFKERISQGWY